MSAETGAGRAQIRALTVAYPNVAVVDGERIVDVLDEGLVYELHKRMHGAGEQRKRRGPRA